MEKYSWVGSYNNYVDEIFIQSINKVVIGQFGGNSSAGQYKNEDGCLVWCSPGEWEFAAILDGHDSAESVELVLNTIESNQESIHEMINKQLPESFIDLQNFLMHTFLSDDFIMQSSKVQGETACLFVLRKENFIWWFSIGDCILHIFHPELTALGEYQQNHRSFFEWVGNNSTYNKLVPSYSTGVKELRPGDNHIFLTTDGLTECPGKVYEAPERIQAEFCDASLEEGVYKLMNRIELNGVRDSTTIVTWIYTYKGEATRPSDMK
ncbi:protein phosphatase 2C domain-containing protein [Rossellomorea aquimaris]|nr:protein phosphatase 2C domain-containing protein [Rossellomorea aquimaris]